MIEVNMSRFNICVMPTRPDIFIEIYTQFHECMLQVHEIRKIKGSYM